MAFLSKKELNKLNFKHLGENVLISDKCSIYNPSNISIGDNTRIDDFCILSAGDGGIEIGRYVHISCFASILGKGKVTMKDYSGISSRVTVFSSSDVYDGEWMTNPTIPSHLTNVKHKDVVIGKHVVVGAHTVILPGVILEDGCSVGALSLVTKSSNGRFIYSGIPAKKLKPRKDNIFNLEKEL